MYYVNKEERSYVCICDELHNISLGLFISHVPFLASFMINKIVVYRLKIFRLLLIYIQKKYIISLTLTLTFKFILSNVQKNCPTFSENNVNYRKEETIFEIKIRYYRTNNFNFKNILKALIDVHQQQLVIIKHFLFSKNDWVRGRKI